MPGAVAMAGRKPVAATDAAQIPAFLRCLPELMYGHRRLAPR